MSDVSASLFYRVALKERLHVKSIAHALSEYDIVLCKRYVKDDRLHVDGDKNMRLLAFAFTIVFVWTRP